MKLWSMTQIIECNNDFTIFSNSNILSCLVMLLVQILTYIDYNLKYNHAPTIVSHIVVKIAIVCCNCWGPVTRGRSTWQGIIVDGAMGRRRDKCEGILLLKLSWVGSFTEMVYLFFFTKFIIHWHWYFLLWI